MRISDQSLLKYGWSGFVGTAVHYATLFSLLKVSDSGPIAASTAGAIAGSFVIGVLNYYFDFKSRSNHFISLGKFLLVIVGSWLLNAAVLYLVLPKMNIVPAQLLASTVVFVWGYSLTQKEPDCV